jgi:hypothetical protein
MHLFKVFFNLKIFTVVGNTVVTIPLYCVLYPLYVVGCWLGGCNKVVFHWHVSIIQ